MIKRKTKSVGVPKRETIAFLEEKKLVKKRDKILMIYGSHYGISGETNTIRIETI